MNTENKIAFIQSCWHQDIVDQLRQSFAKEFSKLNHSEVEFFTVPGAFEIPLHAKKLAQSGRYSAVVAAGLVVNGGIYRHEFVASAVIDGLMQTQLDIGIPIFSAVLTPHHFHDIGGHTDCSDGRLGSPHREYPQACGAALEQFGSRNRLRAP